MLLPCSPYIVLPFLQTVPPFSSSYYDVRFLMATPSFIVITVQSSSLASIHLSASRSDQPRNIIAEIRWSQAEKWEEKTQESPGESVFFGSLEVWGFLWGLGFRVQSPLE